MKRSRKRIRRIIRMRMRRRRRMRRRKRRRRRRWALTLLLLISNATSFSLRVTNFTEIQPDSASAKRISIRMATVLLKGSTETADKGIKATPSLTKRARTRGRRVRVAKEWAAKVVNFGFAELI